MDVVNFKELATVSILCCELCLSLCTILKSGIFYSFIYCVGNNLPSTIATAIFTVGYGVCIIQKSAI